MIRSFSKFSFLIIGALIFAYPFLWMLAGSVKPELEINELGLWSSNISLHSYEQVLTKIPIARAFLNSMIVSLSTTVSVV
jgi:multiple sugar transport system permease protein